MPNDPPPEEAVYQQTLRWLAAGCCEALVHDPRALSGMLTARQPQPSAVSLDSRTVQSTPESGARAGYGGAKRRKGSKTHLVVARLGRLLTACVTAADEQDRAQVVHLFGRVLALMGGIVDVSYVDQGYMGEETAAAAAAQGIRWEVITLPEAKRGFVLLPRRWVVERRFGWLARLRRLARDYERWAETVEDLTFVAFACLLLHRLIHAFSS